MYAHDHEILGLFYARDYFTFNSKITHAGIFGGPNFGRVNFGRDK